MLALWTLLACTTELTETGEVGLVGTVVGPDGQPVAGLEVSTLEARVKTADDGRFAIGWKPPNQLVHFKVQGLHYERPFQADDAGRQVTIALPASRATEVQCPTEPCALELRWPLADGLRAVHRLPCTPGRRASLAAAPVTTPEVGCRVGAGTGARHLSVHPVDRGDTIAVRAASVVRIELSSLDSEAVPDACVVVVSGRAARSEGDGIWAAAIVEAGFATALCDSRPAVPQIVDPAASAAGTAPSITTLEWSRSGPVLDLEEQAPWAESVQLVSEGEPGWALSLAPDAQGETHLPPLGPGRYRIIVTGASEETAVALATVPPVPPGAGVLAVVQAGPEAWVGSLVVESDHLDGRIPVTGP